MLAPILNNCSLDRICKKENGYQFGQVSIKPLEFVDDLADPNHSLMSVHVSNFVIEQIQFEKRPKFSAKKCELLAIGSDDAGYTFDINGRTIKHISTVKYLGDILNAQGSNIDMIKSRVDRCHGSVMSDPDFLGTGHKQIRTRTLFLAPCNDSVGTRPKGNASGKLKMAAVCMINMLKFVSTVNPKQAGLFRI